MASKRHDKVTRAGVWLWLELDFVDGDGQIRTEQTFYRGKAVGMQELFRRYSIPKRRLVDVRIVKMDRVVYGMPEDEFFRRADIIESELESKIGGDLKTQEGKKI